MRRRILIFTEIMYDNLSIQIQCRKYSTYVDWMHSSTQPFSLLGLFSFSGRETTDSYTISASPSIVLLGQGLRAIYSSFDDRTKSNLDLDGKSPLLSDYQKEDLDSISRAQSSISERASLYKQQLTGDLPIGHGCSLTQTVFNGNLC